MAFYIQKCTNTSCASALTVLLAPKDGEMKESEALPQVPCSEFQFLFIPPEVKKANGENSLQAHKQCPGFDNCHVLPDTQPGAFAAI